VSLERGGGVTHVVGECVEMPKEPRGYGTLPFRGLVGGIKSSEERADGGGKLVATRDVKGAPFQIVPKRRSHMACGITDSV
jgi:hypothetical protein